MKKQAGYIWKLGDWWMLRYRDTLVEGGQLVRKQLSVKLAPVEPQQKRLKRAPQHVVALAEEKLKPLNDGRYDPAKNVTIGDFVEHTFFPHMETRRTPSTQHTNKGFWRRELSARCKAMRLRDFRPNDAQKVLDDIARQKPKMKRITLFHIKSTLSAIFRLAINQGFASPPNPVRDVDVPQAGASDETAAYTLSEVLQMLKVLPAPACTAVALAAFSGLRRGELEGLEWPAYTGAELKVVRSIWNGRVGEPKTPTAKASVPVIDQLKKKLDEHWAIKGKPTTGPLFPTRSGNPYSMNNLLADQILPTLERCQHCGKTKQKHKYADHEYSRDTSRPAWRGWHAFRRGLGTILHDLAIDDKTIQAILRHSDVSITQGFYIKTLPQQSVDAMKRFEERVSSIVQ